MDHPNHLILSEEDSVCLACRTPQGSVLRSRSAVLADDSLQDCICPHCRRDISVKVKIINESDSIRPMRPPPTRSKYPKGFVALIYGSAPAYFVGALVTGWSLMKHTTLPKECRVLLCTPDVSAAFRSILSSVWTLQDVEYIHKASPWFYWDYNKSRFKEVFTKLRILKDLHGMFKKVLLLDLDLLIRGEVDSLFDLPAPAAMVRGQIPFRHGEVVPIDAFYAGHRQVLGINCGVMLVEPNAALFDTMIKEVETYSHPEHWPSHGPEQDYLSRFYNAFGQWVNMSCRYNYQVHLTQFGSTEWHHYNLRGHPKVSIFHFSGRLVKPWSLLLDLKIAHAMSYSEIDDFVLGIATKSEIELERINVELNQGKIVSVEEDNDSKPPTVESGEGIDSHFCYGTGPQQKKSRRCYLDRYVHPSWSAADSDSCVEWFRAFKEADEFLHGTVLKLLHSLWEAEIANRH